MLNGSDAPTEDAAADLARDDRRVRTLHLAARGLTPALNHGLRHAAHEVVARMDSDDRCPPDRLAIQARALAADPGVMALGTAWRMETESGECVCIARPPTTALAAAWSLLQTNSFAHGSMMMRRSPVLELGGYNECFERAQDYDLWLRIAARGGIKAIADILYTHVVRRSDGFSSSTLQATAAAKALVHAWERLPPRSGTTEAVLAAALSEPLSPARVAELQARLESEAPTAIGLAARAWLTRFARDRPPTPPDVTRARLLELRAAGVGEAWLWGAGCFAERLRPMAHEVGITVLGLVDDDAENRVCGNGPVRSPAVMARGEHAIVSSDAHEDIIWANSAPHRARGVIVHRLNPFAGST